VSADRPRAGFGRRVSHSHRRSPRRFDPNAQDRRYRLPSENRHVRLRLSARAITLVDRIGVEAAVARIRARRRRPDRDGEARPQRGAQEIVARHAERRRELKRIIG
jgi:large subunit ribosomal protein L28